MTTPSKPVALLPAPYTAAAAADRLIAVAASQIGYHEGKSKSGDWNNDTIFGVWFKLNLNPWCHMFVSWCGYAAGFAKIIPHQAYTPSGFNWFAAKGLVDGRKPPSNKAATGLGKPRRGDIMYVHGQVDGGWRIHHVGIVENVLPDGYIQTIEGNTNTSGSASGDGVYRLKRKVTSKLFFAHPQYATAVIAKPKPAPGAKPVTPPALDKYGQPRTGGRPKVDGAGKQILDLSVLVAGAKSAGAPTFTLWTQMNAACGSLRVLGYMSKTAPLTGPNFKAAWANWQKHLGYKGKDADGIPGGASFSRLIERTGRSKKSSGYQAK